MKGYTHIWDFEERIYYNSHPDMILFVPACAEYFRSTRKDRLTMLVIPELLLERGTNQQVNCYVCDYLNQQIRQGTMQDPDIWDELADAPMGNHL